jgi:large subunit ribosomal protein L19
MSSRTRLAEAPFLRKNPLEFRVGDTVDVAVKIPEGDKERIQVFSGRVIRRKGGGLAETFTVRRIVMGEGVERIFPTNSPRIASVKVVSRGAVRRSKLYYLRSRVGKATRLRAILGEMAADAASPTPQAAAKPRAAEAPADDKAAPKRSEATAKKAAPAAK